MKLTEYIYYVYSYLNIYRNNKIISIYDQYNMGKIGIFFKIIFVVSKINIINIFTKLYKFYNIRCILVLQIYKRKKIIEQTNNLKFIKK